MFRIWGFSLVFIFSFVPSGVQDMSVSAVLPSCAFSLLRSSNTVFRNFEHSTVTRRLKRILENARAAT